MTVRQWVKENPEAIVVTLAVLLAVIIVGIEVMTEVNANQLDDLKRAVVQ
jgi:hypothetical protein